MATASSPAKFSPARLIREMARLPAAELDRIACQLLVLRAAKGRLALPIREAELLAAINRSLPTESRAAYRRLVAKRRAGRLTPNAGNWCG